MNWFTRKKQPQPNETKEPMFTTADVEQIMIGASADIRSRIAAAISGGNDGADTLHNIYLDYGYPEILTFSNFWNMYRRFGIAQNVVELPVEMSWLRPPTIESKADGFNKDLELLIKQVKLFQRLKGLDTRQRVGRYAGMFMRVRDGKKPDEALIGKLSGVGALMQMTPLYESQLKVLTTDEDPTSTRFTLPLTYQFSGSATGSRNENNASAFTIHWTRVVPAAEGADNGGIYGIPVLESIYNSLMDLRKVIGGGAEGFYKNAAQSIVFDLKDAASATANKELLAKFNDTADDFLRNRPRRSLFTPGLEATTLTSEMITPKDFFMIALNDVSAGSRPMIPSTILIGQQTGRLASEEDGKGFLSGINSRNENFVTEMTRDVIDWCIEFGILPAAEYEVSWDDLLALSDEERLENAGKMADTNLKAFQSGGELPFDGEEIREAAGFDPRDEEDAGGEGVEIDEEMAANMEWTKASQHPPLVVNDEGQKEEFTIDVYAKTKDHGIVKTYHDGDVWCHDKLSGCPQYDVIEWAIA